MQKCTYLAFFLSIFPSPYVFISNSSFLFNFQSCLVIFTSSPCPDLSLSLLYFSLSLSLSSLFFSLSFLYFSRFPLSYLVPLISFPLLAKMKMREREREREREKRKTFNAKQSRHHKWFPSFSRFHLFFSFPLKCQSVFAGPSSRHHHKKNSTNWT